MKIKTLKTQSRGFALVITLSLMILLTVVAVGLLTLSSVSLRSTSHGEAMATAKANARLALMLAIADLQKNAGPDQRVTARAEILDSKPDTPEVDEVKQPYWTASWPTGDSMLDVSANGKQPQRKTTFGSTAPIILQKTIKGQWFVSNPTPSTTNIRPTTFDAVTTDTDPKRNAVTLATLQGSTAATQTVSVPLVSIRSNATTQPTGGFGYWVADEGLKAKVNLADPTIAAAADSQLGQAHFLAPQANAIHKIAGLVTDSSKDFRSENSAEQLGKTLDYNTISLLPTSPASLNLKRFMPDITAVSSGVLADVKHGGLKKDLTAGFETGAGFITLSNNFGYDKKTAYRNHPDLTVPYSAHMKDAGAETYEGVTDGLPWAALYAYYNIYKSVIPAPGGLKNNSPVAPISSGSVNALPYTVSPRVLTVDDGNAIGKYGGLVPEVLAQRTDIALESTLVDNKYKLRLRYYPQLILYNPYNCTLNASNFIFTRKYFTFAGNYKEYKIHVLVDGKSIAPDGTKEEDSWIYLNQPVPGQANRYPLANKAGSCDVLAPGETRVFGLDSNVDKSATGLPGAIDCTILTAGPNVSAERSQWAWLVTNTVRKENPTTHEVTFTNGSIYEGVDAAKKDSTVEVILQTDSSLPLGKARLTSGAADTFIGNEYKWPALENGARIFNTNGPDVIYPVPTWPAGRSFANMCDQPYTISGFFIRKKGVNLSGSSKNYSNVTSIIPPYHGNAPYFTPVENMNGVVWHEQYLNQFGANYNSSSSDIQLVPASHTETFVGDRSVGDSPGSSTMPSRVVLRDVPNQPLMSIGQFMHIPTMVFSLTNKAMTGPNPADKIYGRYGCRDAGSMFIGGSLASPFIPTENNIKVDPASTNAPVMILDDSYLANDTLFDRFFFSTVPPAAFAANDNPPLQWTDFNGANNGTRLKSPTTPLPNSRIKPYYKNGEAPLMSDLRDVEKAAANLMLDGAFNVNSTSVNAWIALLSSLSGNDLAVFKSTSGIQGKIAADKNKNPIPRFWSSSVTGSGNQPWDGYRALTDDEVKELATRIVEQVKIRGPFLSMSDFLNRRLGKASNLTRAGCLQAAIDSTTSPDVNKTAKSAGVAVSSNLGSGMGVGDSSGQTRQMPPALDDNMKDGAGNTLNSAVGIPGYLMQQDIVQAFSSAMTVRSDTFVIRTYGESLDATGQVRAKAWAEAVVQRVPEFVDSTTDPDPETAITSLSTINQTFGRRFKVVGFRWLSSNEI